MNKIDTMLTRIKLSLFHKNTEKMLWTLFFLLLVLLAFSFLFSQDSQAKAVYFTTQQPVSISSFEKFDPPTTSILPRHIRVRLQHNENLYQLFERLQLDPNQVTILANSLSTKQRRQVNRIQRGTVIRLSLDHNDKIKQLVIMEDPIRGTSYYRTPKGYASVAYEAEYQKQYRFIEGDITSSLYRDGTSKGMSSKMVNDFANIYAYDIDFANDVRRGDKFSVLYEELLVENRTVQTGNIRIAEFINQGKKITAIYYKTKAGEDGYFTPDGKSMKTRFLRMPVEFSRVSSRFNPRRRHPVLNIIRPHQGVDFAARPGTPIRSVGNGVVSWAGTKGGYGRTVIINHGDGYTTLYAHMRGYARNIRKGRRVKQGQVIGYVGSSGISTGPHLHYEFRVSGVHRDPLKVKIPRQTQLARGELPAFRKYAEQILTIKASSAQADYGG